MQVLLLQALTHGGRILPAGTIIDNPDHTIRGFADGDEHFSLGRVAEWVKPPKAEPANEAAKSFAAAKEYAEKTPFDALTEADPAPKRGKAKPEPVIPETEPVSLEDGKETPLADH